MQHDRTVIVCIITAIITHTVLYVITHSVVCDVQSSSQIRDRSSSSINLVPAGHCADRPAPPQQKAHHPTSVILTHSGNRYQSSQSVSGLMESDDLT